jgi:hypothetical protein
VTGGVRQIVRFNWPFYATAIAAIAIAAPIVERMPGRMPVRVALYSATALAAFWIVGSLVASGVVYDQAHSVFLILTLGLFCGAPAHISQRAPGTDTIEPRILLGLTVFWGLRMVMQWWFYSPKIWRGHRCNTVMHYVFSTVWVYVTAVFAPALWSNL